MAIRQIRQKNDPFLRKKSRDIPELTQKVIELLDDMKDTMQKAEGIGISAVQVGVLRRVILIETEEGELIELINPVLLETRGEVLGMEGCLSIHEETGYVYRPEYVKIKGRNRNWEVVTHEATGVEAVVFCHEMDHLEGVLFTDKIVELTEEELEAMKD